MDLFGIGGMVQGGLDLIGTRMTNTANARMAREQQAFQEHMSNTAHERETYDLQRAGLNRILSISKGGPGASTPPGARAEMQNPLSSATRAYREAETAREQNNLTRQQARKTKVEAEIMERANPHIQRGLDTVSNLPGKVVDLIGEHGPTAVAAARDWGMNAYERARREVTDGIEAAANAAKAGRARVKEALTLSPKYAPKMPPALPERRITESQQRELRRYGPNRIGGRTPDWRWKSLGR